MAYDPRSGYVYAMGVNFVYWYRRVSNPYAMAPVIHPPGSGEEGVYAAIDSKSGRIVWQRRSPWGLEMGSGALTTAGGLLFHVEGDGSVVASNSANGDVLWTFQTGYLRRSGIPVERRCGSALDVRGRRRTIHPRAHRSSSVGSEAGWPLAAKGRPQASIRAFGFSGIVTRLSETDEVEISAVAPDMYHPDEEHFIDEFAFVPQRARVKAHQHVRWTNYGLEVHTIVSSDGTWTTGELRPGQSIVIEIGKPGVYTYFSKEYPFSKGQLIVE